MFHLEGLTGVVNEITGVLCYCGTTKEEKCCEGQVRGDRKEERGVRSEEQGEKGGRG